jgi:hypothetical protein
LGVLQKSSSFGVGLALAGALVLTPDALLIRISGMSTVNPAKVVSKELEKDINNSGLFSAI